MSNFKFMPYLIFLSLVVGCAGNSPKHFDEKLTRLGQKGLILATVTSENRLDESDQIIPGAFMIRKIGEDEEKTYVLWGDRHFRLFTENEEYCLIVLEVDKGDYFISSVAGIVDGDFTSPKYEARIQRNFQAKENEIVYIGNIHLVLRKKASDSEISAGRFRWDRWTDHISIAGTTFDVEINDEYERDVNEFEKAFPNLKDYSVIKRILPPQL